MKPSLVLEFSPWEFADEKTGEMKRGFTLFYVDFESPLNGRKRGYETLRISGPQELAGEIAEVPGYYHLRFRQRAGRAGGKVELALAAVRFAGSMHVPGDAQ
jgi:hypothetical protein